ncbi:MAG: hypothetical protein QW674_06175 [Candidatus Bathyarchaeia archaeon]
MASLEGLPVYVRYKDHVLYKNIQQPIADAVERETIGWLTKQTDEIMLIEHDRTIPNAQIPSGQGTGVIILKSCIIEIRPLPLQKILNWHLNSADAITKGEYALQPKKRKTQPKPKTENTEPKHQCKQ